MHKTLTINFIGSFTTGYVGEVSDESHICNELEYLGHKVNRIPRDIWKARCENEKLDESWEKTISNLGADINIMCKWHHFAGNPEIDVYPDSYVKILRHRSKAPVLYWVWDYMYDNGMPRWHLPIAKEADLYLTNEFGVKDKYYQNTNFYYFPFDVSDAQIQRQTAEKKYNVAFFGSYIGQGDRISWLPEINRVHPVKVFSWNHEEWKNNGFDAEPAVYGMDFAKKIAECKIVLGFNVNDHCWGYWSNRVGKVLSVGGFLLQRWVPGMELFLRDGAEYFSSVEEAINKIEYFLHHNGERERIAQRGYEIGLDKFTSRSRIKELAILMDRYLKGGIKEYQPPKFIL